MACYTLPKKYHESNHEVTEAIYYLHISGLETFYESHINMDFVFMQFVEV